MTTVTFRRPPRAPQPSVPEGEVVLKAPPELPQPDPNSNVWLTALPALSGLGSVMYMLTMGRGPIGYVVGTMFLVSSLAMVVGSLLRQRGSTKGQAQSERREYLRYLDRTRAEVRRTAQAQRDALVWAAPVPHALWAVADGRRLWERRASDDDFTVARVGVGPRYLATPLVPGESAPVEDLDPLSAVALKRFIDAHSVVPELPVQVALRRFASLAVSGGAAECRGLLRAVIAHAATFHAPRDLRVLVCTREPDGADWAWAKWLPHAHHPDELDHAGPVRMVHSSLAGLEDLLGSELSRRTRFSRDAEADPDVPHLLVVLDGGLVMGSEALLDPNGMQGVTVLDLDGRAAALTEAHGVRLDVSDGALRVLTGESSDELGAADTLPVPEAEALAQQLAGFRLDAATVRSEDLATADTSLPGLLGIRDAGRLDLETLWRARPMRDRLKTPIGLSAEGGPLELDIKESAQNGMGPHGLLVGATGSGKSELLRTLVLAMAATHSSEQLNFVLVDFKGGATFAGMSELPHVAAVITNLEDDLSLVDRMREALAGEMNRRQEVLRDAGNLVSVRDYERARQRGAALPPLPSLFVVVDEFSELLAQKPDFADLFVQMGRLGRSLGLHLLLASQRLDEGRLRGLEAHLSYRIGLRTFSEQESRTAIGVPDAHHLPSAPGHGYLKTDTTTLKRFRAAYVSGAHRTAEEGSGATLSGPDDVRPFPNGYVPVPLGLREPEPQPDLADDEFGADEELHTTVLSVMAEQMEGQGPQAHQVWLPPLDEPDTLDGLYGDLTVRETRGLGAAPGRPQLHALIGSVDRPFHQRREPLTLDLSGAGGHVAVVGGPRSGKSTALRTLITSLALRHTPREVQFYCLDFSGTLFALSGLPHVGGVAGRLDAEVVNRTVAEVLEVLEQRELRFRGLGVDSMADYRALRADRRAGDDGPFDDSSEDPFGDVFLVVDGWQVLRQSYPELEEALMGVAGRMLTYGVHLVVSGNRWLDMRMGLRDLIGTKVELKLGDALDSEVDRKAQRTVPAGKPGRGVTKEKLHFLTAVPRVDGERSDAGLADGIADLVRRVADAWQGAPAPKVRLLPTQYALEEVPAGARRTEDGEGKGVVVGVEGSRLEPVVFRPGDDHGLIALGESETGKTSLLRAVGRQVVDAWQPSQAKLVIFDYRMTMLREFSGDSLLGYTTNHDTSMEVVAGLVAGFRERLPGSDVTPEQLRDRSWWSGPEIYLLVDDYDLVATSAGNPLKQLVEFLPQARAIGLHLYVTRQAGGAARATGDPVLARMRELNFPGLLMSMPREESAVWGHRSARRKRGRALLLHRKLGTTPVQLVRCEAPALDGGDSTRPPLTTSSVDR
ncbi:type VII secretion protein EccCa [Streptomyces sp. RK75]|uniref:type VII secretion protein EccCa n=1 Tax=Streptomyces sp. RK75 TaxID=2824895 RepID=UPI001B373EE8|nr:type VII secretion protein EccCa [Streptomyces sp. RK75]MBQ0862818.1 type VII secretion protein EccCa [Streptomyces sp. RK75]